MSAHSTSQWQQEQLWLLGDRVQRTQRQAGALGSLSLCPAWPQSLGDEDGSSQRESDLGCFRYKSRCHQSETGCSIHRTLLLWEL